LTDAAHPFTLTDQFDAAHEIAFGDGRRPAAIIFADRSCTEDVAPWARRLSDGVGAAARVVGVAAVGTVPALFHGVVRGFLHDKPSVLIDWGNEVSDSFGYAGGECLVVAVDGAGAVRARVRGPVSDGGYAEIASGLGAPSPEAAADR
jgi:hypothetical protein